jgi:hypothetical protein
VPKIIKGPEGCETKYKSSIHGDSKYVPFAVPQFISNPKPSRKR